MNTLTPEFIDFYNKNTPFMKDKPILGKYSESEVFDNIKRISNVVKDNDNIASLSNLLQSITDPTELQCLIYMIISESNQDFTNPQFKQILQQYSEILRDIKNFNYKAIKNIRS